MTIAQGIQCKKSKSWWSLLNKISRKEPNPAKQRNETRFSTQVEASIRLHHHHHRDTGCRIIILYIQIVALELL